jgi:excinuclease ABC subunit B
MQAISAPQSAVSNKKESKQISPEEILPTIRQLDRQMHEAADKLEFERAAAIRDEIRNLRKKL